MYSFIITSGFQQNDSTTTIVAILVAKLALGNSQKW